MAVGRQPLPNIYAPPQQQHTFNNRRDRHNGGGHNNSGGGGGNSGGSFQQPAWFSGNVASTQQSTCPPTPYKIWENWNYCHTNGGDVYDTHTSALCGNRSPAHNPNATRANMMGDGWINRWNAQDRPSLSMWSYSPSPPPSPPAAATPIAMPTSVILPHPRHDATWRWTYRVQETVAMQAQQPGQGMMNFVGQQCPAPKTAQIMQQPTQQAVPIMAP